MLVWSIFSLLLARSSQLENPVQADIGSISQQLQQVLLISALLIVVLFSSLTLWNACGTLGHHLPPTK